LTPCPGAGTVNGDLEQLKVVLEKKEAQSVVAPEPDTPLWEFAADHFLIPKKKKARS
jgi:hypothetical protein